MNEALALILACALDAMIGDPKWLPHPVVIIGNAIDRLETLLTKLISNKKLAGIILTAIISGGALLSAYGMEQALFYLMSTKSALFASAAFVYLISTTIASRGLITSVRSVLMTDDINTARARLRHIVGRDTANLDMDAVRRAAIETLAENASDGIVAPLFYFALGGLPLAMFYKAVNTLDSMVGYRNTRYRQLGWASAKLDDIMNLIPARLTGLLIALAAWLVRQADMSGAFKIMRRDGQKHLSPNGGIPEAAMAGALGIRLGGPSVYENVTVEKPYIGDHSAVGYPDARTPALRLAVAASIMAAILAVMGTMLRGAI